jgi:hypothetical protein
MSIADSLQKAISNPRLPCQGRGELDADFRAESRLYPPLPFKGRGDGGEGSKNPALRLVNASGKL